MLTGVEVKLEAAFGASPHDLWALGKGKDIGTSNGDVSTVRFVQTDFDHGV